MYDPTIGRFLSEDPIGFAGDSSNVYRYVGNAATMYVDPSGLWWRERHWFGTVEYHKPQDPLLARAKESFKKQKTTPMTKPSVPAAEKGNKEGGGLWEGVWPTAADAIVDEGNPVAMGTAAGALEAAEGLTAEAAVLVKKKCFEDLNNNPHTREKDIRKAREEWADAQKKLHKLQTESLE